MKVNWKFLDLKCGRYDILRNLIKFKKNGFGRKNELAN
jgi:hypothetical protein